MYLLQCHNNMHDHLNHVTDKCIDLSSMHTLTTLKWNIGTTITIMSTLNITEAVSTWNTTHLSILITHAASWGFPSLITSSNNCIEE